MAEQQKDNNGAAIIAAQAINTAGQLIGGVAQNRRQWRYQQAAMALQQQLNLEAWNLQNAYNTPQQQMHRLQQAGLNPRLIYGSGSSAPNMGGPLDPATAPVREALDVSKKLPDLLQYYQVRQMDAQWKQTTAQTELMQKNAALKDLETGLKNLALMKEKIRSEGYKGVVEAEQNMQKWVSLRSEELLINEARKGENLVRQGNLMDQLGTMRDKQMTSLDLDNAFKVHRNELAKLGIYSSDHPAFRVLIQAAKRMNIDLGELLMEGAEKLKYLLELKK